MAEGGEGGKMANPLSLKTLAVFTLAKVSLGQLTLPEDITRMQEMYPELLETHITSLLENTSILPATLYKLLKDTLQLLKNGLLQAHAWEIAHTDILPFSILNAEMAGRYAATRYISSDGFFEQRNLIDDYVDDESLPLIARYRVACNYCCQEKIMTLWNMIQADPMIEFMFLCNFRSETELVQIWTGIFNHGHKQLY